MVTINGVTRTWEATMDCLADRWHVFEAPKIAPAGRYEAAPAAFAPDLRCRCGEATWGQMGIQKPEGVKL